jgi:hypothetical protein
MPRCSPYPLVGERCTGLCAFPLRCVGGTCVATGKVGELCLPVPTGLCITGVCLAPDGGRDFELDSRCAAPLANGGVCEVHVECQSGVCDTRTSTCAAACN